MAKQDRAVRTRQELIRSAAEAFSRGGFALSSLTDISARAGVSSGALHFHFASKRALGEAVETAAAQTLRRIIAQSPLGHPVPLQTLVDTSHVLAQRLVDDVVLRAGFGLGSDATWREGVELWGEWHSWVRSVLTLARRRGNLATDVVLDDVVSAVTAAVVGFEVLGRADAEWCSRRSLTRFWALMLPRLSSDRLRTELDPEGTGAGMWPEEAAVVPEAG
ncbi:ScbR family autoregulator-binding transcription factor [Streptomyces sp. SP18CS02]|uniref:ScbR family autoregulator-binding transcription factor n=1 Tax=Streptomyces sp. SP18CS02 TaxID=3002531 RepID=UPI002E785DC9|nr:ScbR family autoregulator-binding transcription factor [Streptomyces sp. SP18CS02]MEE1757460.1 ScbR family autoregulator-binding transcription factor [Streptomyces sp. SP18CS02]